MYQQSDLEAQTSISAILDCNCFVCIQQDTMSINCILVVIYCLKTQLLIIN